MLRSSKIVRLAVVAITVGGLAVGAVGSVAPAAADETTVSQDTLRTGWDPHEPNLNAATVAASDYGQLFGTQLDGQVYAQPIVADNTLLVATENNNIYGLDPVSGTIRWSRNVGPAWPAGAIGCGDLVPNIGITGTPVYDPATDSAYFTSKVDDGPDADHPHWYLHAIDVTTGAERANFPVLIHGSPSNSPGHPFNAFTAMQRPGLLLLDGHIYAGFASHCDAQPYVGYVMGWDAATGSMTAMWSTEAGSSDGEAGIWQAGGGLVSDGSGRIIVATGNGFSPARGPGDRPPGELAESVVRLAVGGDGSLSAKDFFSPFNNTNLDRDDADLGSGGPLALPDGYGTTAHAHLLVEIGKDGRLFLLDRDNLGGTTRNDGGALQIGGPYAGVWGHPAFWGGGSGYVYVIGNGGPLLSFQVGVDGDGQPALTQVGQSRSIWGYTSGSPVVTSDGTTPGSALVWAVYSTGSDGSGGQLRAYAAVPDANGILPLKYSAPIGHAAKFSVPATDGGRVYVGSRDGMIFGFGRPVVAALNGPPTDFGTVAVGRTATRTVHLTATRDVTIDGASTDAPFGAAPSGLPIVLRAGDSADVQVSFSPSAPGAQSATLTVTTDDGTFAFDLHGTATRPGIAATPDALDFGDIPVSGASTLGANITNTSRVSETVQSVAAPHGAFHADGLPATGTTIAPGSSVALSVTFRPKHPGTSTGRIAVVTDTGHATIRLHGNGVTGAPHLTITPTRLRYGPIRVGGSRTRTFDIENTGNLVLTITKAAPPAGEFGTTTPISEGQQLAPGQVVHQQVTFTPTGAGPAQGTYLITGNDGQGEQTVTFSGRSKGAPVAVRGPASGEWTLNGSAAQKGGRTVLTTTASNAAGDAVSPVPITPAGTHVSFTARLGGGSGADGMAFALLDATTSSPTSLGGTGGDLGFNGLTGVAVALDTYQNASDPSANFAGIAVADPSTSGEGAADYVATKRLPTSLRTGTHTVDVVVTPHRIRAVIDGKYTVSHDVPVPRSAYLAFTGATGGLTDFHVVRDVAITRAPSAGPILGVSSLCLTHARPTGGAAGARVSSCTASTRQDWQVQGDRTLTSAGLCLTAGSSVTLATCDGSAAQVWTPRPNGTLASGTPGQCLSVPDRASSGAVVGTAPCRASRPGEKWTLPL